MNYQSFVYARSTNVVFLRLNLSFYDYSESKLMALMKQNEDETRIWGTFGPLLIFMVLVPSAVVAYQPLPPSRIPLIPLIPSIPFHTYFARNYHQCRSNGGALFGDTGTNDDLSTDNSEIEENDEEREMMLSEILSLTRSFEEVQETIRANSDMFREQIESYESHIDKLNERIRNATDNIQIKDEAVSAMGGVETEILKERDGIREELNTARSDLQTRGVELATMGEELTELRKQRDELTEELKSTQNEMLDGLTEVRDTMTRELVKEKSSSKMKEEMYGNGIRDARTQESEKIKELTNQVDIYERERCSLRKLTVLGLKRAGSLLSFKRSRENKTEKDGTQ